MVRDTPSCRRAYGCKVSPRYSQIMMKLWLGIHTYGWMGVGKCTYNFASGNFNAGAVKKQLFDALIFSKYLLQFTVCSVT